MQWNYPNEICEKDWLRCILSHFGEFSNLPGCIFHLAIDVKLNVTLPLEEPGEEVEVLVTQAIALCREEITLKLCLLIQFLINTSLCYSGEGKVNDCGFCSIRLDVVVLVVQSEVDVLFFGSLDQNISSVHITMFKLHCLRERERERLKSIKRSHLVGVIC